MKYADAAKRQVYMFKHREYTTIQPWFMDTDTKEMQYHLENSTKEACEKQVLQNCVDLIKSWHAKQHKQKFKVIQGGKQSA